MAAKSQTPAMVTARNQAAEARAKTPRQNAEADQAREGARLGRIMAERDLAVTTLETITALKAEGHPVKAADYIIGETPEGDPVDCRDIIRQAAAATNSKGHARPGQSRRQLVRMDGRMTAAELSSIVTAAARNVTAGINRRTAGQGKVTTEDWEDLTSSLTLAALAREAEAAAAIRGDTLAAALRGPEGRRDNLDTLPQWRTIKAAEGDSPRDAWIKALTANEGRTWARLRAEAARAAAVMIAESHDLRDAAANEAAAERREAAANEAAETAAIAMERLHVGRGQKAAAEAAEAALDGLSTPERAALKGRTLAAQKQAQKRGRRYLLAALGNSLDKARDLAAEAFKMDAERLTPDQAAEADLDTLAYLAESNRAHLARVLADAYEKAISEAEQYRIMRAAYGAPIMTVAAETRPPSSPLVIGPGDKGEPIRRAYRPAFTTSDLAALPERTPGPGNVATLATRAMPAVYGPRALPTRPTNHDVAPTPGLPVKRAARRDAPVLGWTCEGFREAAYRAKGETVFTRPTEYLPNGRPTA